MGLFDVAALYKCTIIRLLVEILGFVVVVSVSMHLEEIFVKFCLA